MTAKRTTPTGRPTKAWIESEIQRLMTQQAGLVAYRQLRALGLSARSITERAARGELVQRTEHPPRPGKGKRSSRDRGRPATKHITTGVFSAHGAALSLESQQWKAMLSGPAGSRLAGLSSCVLLDLEQQRGTLMYVVHPGCDWDPPKGIDARRTTHLPDADLAETNGLLHFTASRSVMDAARVVDDERLDDLIDRTVELRTYDEADMRRVIASRRMLPEASRLEAALNRLDSRSGEYRSRLERKTMRLIETSSRIPKGFVVNVVADGYGHRPDLHLPGTRIIIECDGKKGHTTSAERIADDEREEILRALGYRFLRLTWHQVVYEPERTLERIEAFVLANCVPPVPAR